MRTNIILPPLKLCKGLETPARVCPSSTVIIAWSHVSYTESASLGSRRRQACAGDVKPCERSVTQNFVRVEPTGPRCLREEVVLRRKLYTLAGQDVTKSWYVDENMFMQSCCPFYLRTIVCVQQRHMR